MPKMKTVGADIMYVDLRTKTQQINVKKILSYIEKDMEKKLSPK